MGTERRGHPLLIGLVAGVLIGFGLGWWFPPPPEVDMEKVRESCRRTAREQGQKAKRHLAEFSADVSEELNEDKQADTAANATADEQRLVSPQQRRAQDTDHGSPAAPADGQAVNEDLDKEIGAADTTLDGLRGDVSPPAPVPLTTPPWRTDADVPAPTPDPANGTPTP